MNSSEYAPIKALAQPVDVRLFYQNDDAVLLEPWWKKADSVADRPWLVSQKCPGGQDRLGLRSHKHYTNEVRGELVHITTSVDG